MLFKNCHFIQKNDWLRILFLAGLFIPLLYLILSVFWHSEASWSTLIHLYDSVTWYRLGQSLLFSLLMVFFSILFALPIYIAWAGQSTKLKPLSLLLCVLPLSYPPFTVASGWMTWAASWDQSLEGRIVWGGEHWLSQCLYTIPGAAWVLALCYWPIVFFILAAWSQPNRISMNAAEIYLTPWQRWRTIIFPSWIKPLRIASILLFSLGMIQFTVPSLLQVHTYPLEIYLRLSALLEETEALFLCLPYLLIVPFLGWLIIRGLHDISHQRQEASIGAHSLTLWICMTFLALAVLFLSLFVPVIGLYRHSGTLSNTLQIIFTHTARITNSLFYAGVGTLLLLGLGTWFTSRKTFSHGKTIPAALIFLFILPGIIVAAAWLQLRSLWPGRLPTMVSYGSLLAAYTTHYFILGYGAGVILWNYFGTTQKEILSLWNLSPWQRITRAYLPTFIFPGLMVSIILFLLIWGDIACTILLHPPGGESLSVEYYNLLHYGSETRTAAMGLILLTVPALCLLLVFLLLFLLKSIKKYNGIRNKQP